MAVVATAGGLNAGWRRFRDAVAHWGFAQYGRLLAFWAVLSLPLALRGWGAWSVLSLPLLVALIAGITGLVLAAMLPVSRFVAARPHFIHYVTTLDQVSTHGTLSMIDGVPQATWTTQEGDDKTSADGLLDGLTFRTIWNLARSTRPLKRFAVKKRLEALDFHNNVVLTFDFIADEQHVFATFLIPHQGSFAGLDELLARIRATIPSA